MRLGHEDTATTHQYIQALSEVATVVLKYHRTIAKTLSGDFRASYASSKHRDIYNGNFGDASHAL